MGWSPPRKITVVFSVLILILGLAIGLVATGFLVIPELEAFFGGNTSLMFLVSLILLGLAWLILLIGVLVRGL
ncbi:MAG: hypothetical protein ACTSRS_09600 [Candidatus Helarchaeota archaeon]